MGSSAAINIKKKTTLDKLLPLTVDSGHRHRLILKDNTPLRHVT